MVVHKGHRNAAGFTLTELIIVLVIVGIVIVVAMPRFAVKQDFDARGYMEETLSAVRYAQKFAVASGCDVQVTVNGSGYSLKQRASLTGPGCSSAAGFATPVVDPSLQDKTGGGAHAFADDTPSGLTVTGAMTFYYDKIGRPRDVATGAAVTAPQTVTVAGAHTSWTLTVEPDTGYVHL